MFPTLVRIIYIRSIRLYFLNKLKVVLNNLVPSSNADRDLVQSALHVDTVCLLKEVTISLVVSARGWKNLCFAGGYWGGGVSGSWAGTLSSGFWHDRNRFRTGGSRGRSIWRHWPQYPVGAGGRCPVTSENWILNNFSIMDILNKIKSCRKNSRSCWQISRN